MGKIDFGNAFSKGWQGFTANIGTLIVGTLLMAIISMTIILIPIMMAGFLNMCLKAVRGEKVEVGDVFAGFSSFGRFFVGGLLLIAVNFVGMLACGVGLFVTNGITMFLFAHMIISGKGAGESLGDCWRYFKSDWLMAIVLAFVSGFIAQIGAYAFGVGVLLSAPFAWCVVAAAYYDVFGDGAAPAMAQPAAPIEP